MNDSAANPPLEPVATGVSIDADGMLVALGGAVTVGDAERLLAAAEATAARGGDAVVDAAAVTHLDGAAVQVLIALKAKLARNGKALRLAGLPEPVATLLSTCGFGDLAGAAV